MALATWWRDDALPLLTPLPGFDVTVGKDADAIARLASLTRHEAAARLDAGHRNYMASVDGVPAAYGWVATVSASIGELDIAFGVPDHDRYLWDFATLPAWRGLGIYPRLLQVILAREGTDAERFWIVHAPENAASASGIAKAGFTAVSELSFLPGKGVGALVMDRPDRARFGAALLGVSTYEAVQAGRLVSPCWRCVIEQHAIGAVSAPCWPAEGGPAHACACVVVDPKSPAADRSAMAACHLE
jgi:GNAT superfamily N-acetyltransferase